MKINIYLYDDCVNISGHANNQVCARVSTTFQLMRKFLIHRATDCSIESGRSYIKLGELKKNEKPIFNKFCEAFEELKLLYPNQLVLEDHREEEK